VIAIDTNILVYAHRAESAWHEVARRCLEDLANSPQPWCIPLRCAYEYLSVVTNRRLFDPPTPVPLAIEHIEALRRCPSLSLVGDDAADWSSVARLVGVLPIAGRHAFDAAIAATCLRNGVSELWTADRDFSRFPELRTRNPLLAVNERRRRYRARRPAPGEA